MTKTKSIESKTINAHQYTGHYIPASKACAIAFKLASFLSGGNTDVTGLIGQKDNSLILDILSHTLRDGVSVNHATFDDIYTGNLKELAEALMYAAEANFADFLRESDIGSLSEKWGKGVLKTTEL